DKFVRTPGDPSNAACPQGQRIRLAFHLGTFLWAKQRKVPRPPGRDPACHERRNIMRSLQFHNQPKQKKP
ncbi:hypothetical protein, partial [Hydrogenophaga sp.]|uniref:hypothetical protein n=1 Tax=Hydrogenophaga sp. TaxID=1904254 RepID=UPI003AF816FC